MRCLLFAPSENTIRMTTTIKHCEICGRHVNINEFVAHRDECSQEEPADLGVITPGATDDVRGGGTEGGQGPMGHPYDRPQEYHCDTCGREITTSFKLREHQSECEEDDHSAVGVVTDELTESELEEKTGGADSNAGEPEASDDE